MKIAVTWSNGFVWSYVVKYFSKDYKILAFNRNIEESKWNIDYLKWDIRDKYLWKIDCDIFIHSAADTTIENSKITMINNNVKSNKNIVDLLNNSECKHFIYISSSSVYQWLSGLISSNVIINQENLLNSYSLSKYLSEQYLINNLNKSIKLTILRPRAIYGKWDNVLVPKILKNKLFSRLILPWNWQNKTSITNINDFISVIDEIMVHWKKWIYNCFTKTDTYENLYKKIVIDYKLKWIIKVPIFIFKFLMIFNKNKYSYIIDTFDNDKILK